MKGQLLLKAYIDLCTNKVLSIIDATIKHLLKKAQKLIIKYLLEFMKYIKMHCYQNYL